MRLITVILLLVSIGLFASLLPQTSFAAHSSGEFVDTTRPIWPDYSVEQSLPKVPEVISQVRIWAAAGLDHGEAAIGASILRADSREQVRQVRIRVRPRIVISPYILHFPPYEPKPGEKLTLQLWVAPHGDNHVYFGTSNVRGNGPPPAINLQPTASGPLAYELIWKGASWRAALAGSTPDLARLAGAIGAGTLAIAITLLSHPLVSRPLRNTTRRVRTAFLSLADRIHAGLRLLQNDRSARTSPDKTSTARRAFYVFPWLIPAFAILHYLANNLLFFGASESIAIFVVVMAVVTITFVALRLIFKTAAVAAALTGLLGTAFFSYGHLHVALGDHADARYLLGLGVPIVLGLGALLGRNANLARKMGMTLNLGSFLLVLLPAYQIATDFYAGSRRQAFDPSDSFPGLDKRLAETRDRLSRDQLRDIYYIILDEYPRSGSPPEFDNGKFLEELEKRGFYIAAEAQSDSPNTVHSIPSSLNMKSADELASSDMRQLNEIADDHTLGRILKTLGYRYVHVSSGWIMTDTSRNADLIVEFTPSGNVVSKPTITEPFSFEEAVRSSRTFTTTFLLTTAVRPFLPHEFIDQRSDNAPYVWQHPFRTLAWLDFMKSVGSMERPKFVFAHLLKPHSPYSFDRFGSVNMDLNGWSDDHDPTVPGAFYGQIIWLNGQMLEVIDAILDDYEQTPIIVIAGDHGYRHGRTPEGRSTTRDVLATFLLPDGGESAVYPSITSVNHFRAILDYYFELDLGLLEDKIYGQPG